MGRKLIRFLPMSMLSVCFFAIVLYIYYVVTGEWWNNGVVSVWLFFKSFLLIGTGGAIKNTWYLNPPTWYLSVLIICLGLYWIILKFTNRYSINYKYVFLGVVFIGVGIQQYNINLPFFNFDVARGYIAFFIGLLLVDYYKYAIKRNNTKTISIVSTIIIIVFILLLIFDKDYSLIQDNQNLVLSFLLFPALIGFSISNIGDKLLNHKIFGILGGVSFEIYLWHYIFIVIINMLTVTNIIQIVWDDKKMLLFTLAVIIFSFGMYGLENLINKFINRKRVIKVF